MPPLEGRWHGVSRDGEVAQLPFSYKAKKWTTGNPVVRFLFLTPQAYLPAWARRPWPARHPQSQW